MEDLPAKLHENSGPTRSKSGRRLALPILKLSSNNPQEQIERNPFALTSSFDEKCQANQVEKCRVLEFQLQ